MAKQAGIQAGTQAGTQAGKKISNPDELKTLKPTDIARVGKDIYRRDLAGEQKYSKDVWKGGLGTPETQSAFNKAYYSEYLPQQAQQQAQQQTQQTQQTQPTQPRIFDKAKIGEKITQTFTNTPGIGNKLANKQFKDAAFRYAYGRDARQTDIENTKGQTVSGLLKMLGVDDLIPNLGYDTHVQENTDAIGNGAVGSSDNTQGNTQVDSNKPLTLQDRMNNYEAAIEKTKADKSEEVGLAEKNETTAILKAELDDMTNDMDFDKILKIESKNLREDAYDAKVSEQKKKGLLRSTINIRLGEIADDFNLEESQRNREQLLEDATKIYNYNRKVTQYNLAKGESEQARKEVEESADNYLKYRAMAIEDMERQGVIDRQEASDLQTKNNNIWQKEQAGYVPIEPNNYETMVREYGENRIYTDAYGDSYLRPDLDKQVVSTINVDGQLWGLNKNGDKIKNYGRTTSFNFSEQDDGSVLVTDPATGEVITSQSPEATTLSIGTGTITGINGSDKWEYGLDFVLAGGKGAEVKSPFMGEVIFAGKNGGFGNQVKIDVGDGTEVWLSHLDSIDVAKGDYVSDQQIIGTQGNTGDVYSLTGGDGTHLDITMKKPNGDFYKASEVAEYLGYQKPTEETQPENITEDGYDISKFTQEYYNSNFGQKVLNNEQQYQTNFLGQPAVKDFISVQNKAASMQNIIDLGVGGPADLALVFDFMKALDPTSVVRESEYESAAKSGNIFAGAMAKFNGYLKEEGGILPEKVKEAFIKITNEKLAAAMGTYEQIRNQFRKTAYEQGLNPNHVAPDLLTTNKVDSETNDTTLSVTTPDGQVFTFPDKESLNNFKEAAGL